MCLKPKIKPKAMTNDDGGMQFHAAGAAYENARCPAFSHVRGCS